MSLYSIFDVAGSGMSAQTARLNTTASNLSNAETPASSAEAAYKGRYPVFSTVVKDIEGVMDKANAGVRVEGFVENTDPVRKQYQPGHALADKDGYVYYSNVNTIEEMANMISASRSYQMNTQVMNTAKQLMLRTLQLGK